MQKRILYIFTNILFISVLSGCGDSNVALPEDEGGQIPIAFSTQGKLLSDDYQQQTRAIGDAFPNNSIAIVAASQTIATGNPAIGENTSISEVDWSSTNHWSATAGNEAADGTYPITMNPARYWPFYSGEYLAFTAYSPATHATIKKKGDTGAPTNLKDTELQVKVNADNATFPNLLYLENIAGKDYNAVGPFNKTQGTVRLGEFHHAMAKVSKVTVKCVYYKDSNTEIPAADYGKLNISISSLTIGTKRLQGTFDFLNPTGGWTLASAESTARTLYTLVNSSSKLTAAHEINGDYYLLPGTQADSEVNITLQDGTEDHVYSQKISEFKTATADTYVTLEQEKQVELTIKIMVMNVSIGDSDDNISIKLEGDLTDWIDKGNSDVTIN